MLSVRAARRTPACQAKPGARSVRAGVSCRPRLNALREDLVDAAAVEWSGSVRAVAAVPVDYRGAMPALAVNQHQRVVGRQVAQHGGADHRRYAADRLGVGAERRDDGPQTDAGEQNVDAGRESYEQSRLGFDDATVLQSSPRTACRQTPGSTSSRRCWSRSSARGTRARSRSPSSPRSTLMRPRARLPEGVTLTVWQNDAESLNNQLSLIPLVVIACLLFSLLEQLEQLEQLSHTDFLDSQAELSVREPIRGVSRAGPAGRVVERSG